MTNKTIIEKVTKDIQDTEKLVANFKNSPSIPPIELDLALSKLRDIYDIVLMLKDNNNIKDTPEELLFIEEKPKVPEMRKESAPKVKVVQEKEEKHPVAERELTLSKEEKTEKIEKPKVEVSEVPAYHIQEKPAAKIISESDIPKQVVKTQAKKTYITETLIGDHYKDNKSFINEKLGGQDRKQDLTAKLQSSPIKTISGSIGINDKFFFIRELFKGNTEEFQLTVGMLDNSHNFNSAYNYLMEHFDWDMESEPVQLLLNLIRRKFISQGNE